MNLYRFCVLLLSLAVIGCSKSNNTDPQPTPIGSSDTNRFWIFPNPGKDPATGVYTTNDASYAQAYYSAIDPLNERATLNAFKIKNGFETAVTGVSEINVIFRDAKDLGYGRKMTVRFTDPSAPGYVAANHTVSAFVENYQVVPFAGADYSSLNLEAAITGNTNYHVGTNAIEYSIVGGVPMTRFYTYAPGTGTRLNTVNLDGRGQKAMPSVCINCHGGRADPLYTSRVTATPTTTFPNGGNVRARMQPINVDTVEFWTTAPYRRLDQEEALRQINYAIFCTHSYPYPGPVPASPSVDNCRPLPSDPYGGNDYQGAAAEMMKNWYSAGAINTQNTAMTDSYVPAGWTGQEPLYNNVVKQYCRVCHSLRGTENQSDINFDSYSKFERYADRIKHHVFDRGNMPLGLLIYNEFWETSAPQQLADWLTSVNPVYNPMRVGGGATGVPVQPSGSLTDPSFLAMAATNTTTYSVPGIYPTLAASFAKPTTFSNIKTILQDTNNMPCTGCHFSGVNGVGYVNAPPIAYTDFDRDGDSDTDLDDEYEFYKALRGRANLTDFQGSPLLRRPTTLLHGAGYVVLDTTSAAACGAYPGCEPSVFGTYGAYYQAVIDTFTDWIEHGAPYSYTGTTPNY